MSKHTSKPFPYLIVAAMTLIPVASVPLGASLTAKHETVEQLHQAMDEAEGVYASGRGLFSAKSQKEKAMIEARDALDIVMRQKAVARRALVLARRDSDHLQQMYGLDMTNSGSLMASIQKEQGEYTAFARYLHGKNIVVAASGPDLGVTFVRNLLSSSLGDITDAGMRTHAISRARNRILVTAVEAKQAMQHISSLEEDYAEFSRQYEEAWKNYSDAKGAYDTVANRIAEVQRITNEVQSQITQLQRELARIDAQLISKLERELIEKGLMNAQPGERSDGRIRSKQVFRWPVMGRISAGFHNSSYEEYFGVSHQGMDIVVGQGTPVSAVADGVVYLARDGGKYGYSYVLIGHRDGIATLYGHLSQISVTSGQEIAAGQIVGLSGGTPGTHGAGPMTTGAHLHFEMIRNGEHINPVLLLP